MSSSPISIIIPAFNQLKYCQDCIASLRRCTPEAYQLILVDNGSTDGAGEFFDLVPNAEVVHAEQNLGFAGGVNLGLAKATGHVVLLNSDTVLSPRWLERLIRPLLADTDVGLVGPMTNNAPGPQQLDGLSLKNEAAIDAFSEHLAEDRQGVIVEVTRLVGFCMLIRDAVVQEVGLFDEQFEIGNFEDDDYCTRVRKAGYRLVAAHDCFVYHHGGRTFSGMGIEGEAFDTLLDKNRSRYEAKWEVHLPKPKSAESHADELNARAQEALTRGKQEEAIGLLRAAIEACPAAAIRYNDLGAVVWAMGKHQVAYNFFRQALQQNRDFLEAQDNACVAAEKLGQVEEHQRWFESLGKDR